MKIYRQGDVLVKSVTSLPKNREIVENKEKVVLAYGEVTGHCHQFTTKEAKEYTSEGRRFLNLDSGAQLKHEEHSTITFPKGYYEIIQQVQYTPEEIRKVLD